MAAILPPIPRFVMTIFEPISLVAGALAPVVAPEFFVSTQLAHLRPHPLLETERVLALQLGNLYVLLALIGVFVLNTTKQKSVVHGYVWALLIGDVGHIGVTAFVMGRDNFLNVGSYNATTTGNITATVFLCLTRSLYLLGLLGRDREPELQEKKAS